jgi:hypothetical protein
MTISLYSQFLRNHIDNSQKPFNNMPSYITKSTRKERTMSEVRTASDAKILNITNLLVGRAEGRDFDTEWDQAVEEDNFQSGLKLSDKDKWSQATSGQATAEKVVSAGQDDEITTFNELIAVLSNSNKREM